MFLGMNKAQWSSLLRTALTVLGTYLVSSGKLTNEQLGQITNLLIQLAPLLVVIGSIVWGVVARSDKATVSAVGAMPGVEVKVNTAPEAAAPAGAVAAALDKDNNHVNPV